MSVADLDRPAPSPGSERQRRGHRDGRGRAWLSHGRDYERRRGHDVRICGGEAAPPDVMCATTVRIARRVEVPVTVYGEAGHPCRPLNWPPIRRAPARRLETSRTPITPMAAFARSRPPIGWLKAVRHAATVRSGARGILRGARTACIRSPQGEPRGCTVSARRVSRPAGVPRSPQTPALARSAAVGMARESRGPFLHFDAVAWFGEQLAASGARTGPASPALNRGAPCRSPCAS